MTKAKSSGLTMPLAEKIIMTARALSWRRERNPALREGYLVVVLVFKEFWSLLCLFSYSCSFGRLISLQVGPTPPDIFSPSGLGYRGILLLEIKKGKKKEVELRQKKLG